MLMVEARSRDGSGVTIWIRLPASERAAYWEFGEAPETALPERAILLIGHNGEFEKLFDDAEGDDQLVQSRGDRHVPRRQFDHRQTGNDAAIYTAARTAVLTGEDDDPGAAVWRQITGAVEELRRER
jgi:hypothetical protein